MMGYTGRARVSRRNFGPGPGVIWLDDLMCRGTENSLADCPGTTWGQSDCTHEEDVAVECNVREDIATITTTTTSTAAPTTIAPPQPVSAATPKRKCFSLECFLLERPRYKSYLLEL